MTSRLEYRRRRVAAEYGFDFPPDFHRFWEFASRLAPLNPLEALSETLGVTLVGPFEILSGRFDGKSPRHSLLLHWRYHDDPPEFFTALAGDTDGLHWGYYLDEPGGGTPCIASFYARDAFEMSVDGDTLFEAVRLHLEFLVGDIEEGVEEGDDGAGAPEALSRLDEMRDRIRAYETADRTETGEDYVEKYAGRATRNNIVVAETMEGLGIVVPRNTYRALSRPDPALRRMYRKESELMEVVNEARDARTRGFAGTCLKLGKDLWAMGGKRRAALAREMLEGAYKDLGREALANVLATHMEHRMLPSVDVLENEEQG